MKVWIWPAILGCVCFKFLQPQTLVSLLYGIYLYSNLSGNVKRQVLALKTQNQIQSFCFDQEAFASLLKSFFGKKGPLQYLQFSCFVCSVCNWEGQPAMAREQIHLFYHLTIDSSAWFWNSIYKLILHFNTFKLLLWISLVLEVHISAIFNTSSWLNNCWNLTLQI